MPEYLLFTTTRYDEGLVKFSWNNDRDKPCPFLLRANHYQRLMSAAWDHEWTRVLKVLEDYEKFKLLLDEAVQSYKMSNSTDPIALRMRIAIDHEGAFQITCVPVPPLSADPSLLAKGGPPTTYLSNLIEVRLDPASTEPSLFTRTKTTKRAHYDQARVRSGIPGLLTPQGPYFEALLIDWEDHIMESDIYNVAFYRGGRWVTPNTRYGCLPGVFRGFLLEQGLIEEDQDDIIIRDNIRDGEYVLLCNGAQGCRMGAISLGNNRTINQ